MRGFFGADRWAIRLVYTESACTGLGGAIFGKSLWLLLAMARWSSQVRIFRVVRGFVTGHFQTSQSGLLCADLAEGEISYKATIHYVGGLAAPTRRQGSLPSVVLAETRSHQVAPLNFSTLCRCSKIRS
jgi:hypothetical protein